MKPTTAELAEAVLVLSEIIPFFPQTDLARRIMAEEIDAFVNSKDELDWFVRMCIRLLTKYEGVPMLRAVHCIRFKPADGLVPNCQVPGYTTEELEGQYRMKEMAENDKRMAEYQREARLGPAEDRKPFELPEMKKIPPPKERPN